MPSEILVPLSASSLILLCLTVSVSTECPGNVKVSASNCFSTYKSHYVNMQKRENTLFTGVDMEILRSFCSSFLDAMKCITDLKSKCSSNSNFQINSTLADFEVAVDELSYLCNDDVIYEVYARQRRCFEENRAYSMRCFDNIMNTSVRLLRRIEDKPLGLFCSDMNKLLSCIGNNIRRNCNNEAAGLVDKLVKPMVRRSSQCDSYRTTPMPELRTRAPSKELSSKRDKNSVYSDDGRNSGWAVSSRYNHFQNLFVAITVLVFSSLRYRISAKCRS